MSEKPLTVPEDVLEVDVDIELARKSQLDFMEYTWPYKNLDFLVGEHMIEACDVIDDALDAYEDGESQFILMKMPFRHHKSQIVSRSLPPRWLGRFPETDIIMASYGQDLSNGFSRDAMSIVKSEEYKRLYPEVSISASSSSVGAWNVDFEDGGSSRTAWTSLGGSITGKGADLLIIDDFLKGRADAESATMRDKIWRSFKNDLMTRRANKCVVIILATPWHVDDIFGRIEKEMAKNPSFPRFKEVVFPAKSPKYKTGYLFPEKFSESWYEEQYATLGAYDASGLLDCDPKVLEGLLIKCKENVNYQLVDEKPAGFGASMRAWDLASSKKEVGKSDPDWTVGVKGALKTDFVYLENEHGKKMRTPTYSLYIEDIVRIREEAIIRNRTIQNTAVSDGTKVICGIEAFAGYKDAHTTLRDILKGVVSVRKVNLTGDKVSKATQHIVIPFELGRVYIDRKIPQETLNAFLATLESFPAGVHDDDVDAVTILVAMLKTMIVDYSKVND